MVALADAFARMGHDAHLVFVVPAARSACRVRARVCTSWGARGRERRRGRGSLRALALRGASRRGAFDARRAKRACGDRGAPSPPPARRGPRGEHAGPPRCGSDPRRSARLRASRCARCIRGRTQSSPYRPAPPMISPPSSACPAPPSRSCSNPALVDAWARLAAEPVPHPWLARRDGDVPVLIAATDSCERRGSTCSSTPSHTCAASLRRGSSSWEKARSGGASRHGSRGSSSAPPSCSPASSRTARAGSRAPTSSFFHPSRRGCRTLLQAMAAGCAIVATDCPSGPRELLEDGADGTCGALVPPGDAEALAEAIVRTMTAPGPAPRGVRGWRRSRLTRSPGDEALSADKLMRGCAT